jgi:hypothetical protein
MIKGKTMFALFALAGVALSGGVAYAAVASSHPIGSSPNHTVDLSDFSAVPTSPVFLEAAPGGTTVDLRVTRNQIMYEITWQGTASTVASSSVRLQGAGTAMDMVSGAMPGSITAVEGVISVSSPRMLAQLVANPGSFTASATGMARFRRVGSVDFNRILHVGPLVSVDSGDQEVGQGDIGAHATVFVGARTSTTNNVTIDYAATWNGVASPTELNVNQGAAGAIGNLTATLFKATRGLNPTIVAVAGTTTAPAASVAALQANPAAFHTNLLTAKFPAGAVRGQLFTATTTPATMPPTTMPTMPTTTKPMPTTTTPQPTTTMPTTTKPMPTMTTPAMPAPTTVTAGSPPHW